MWYRPVHPGPETTRGRLRYSALLGCLLLSACHPRRPASAARPDSTAIRALAEAPVVREPSVVAFWLAASDTLRQGEGADLLDDFRSYTALVAPDLDDAGITLVATTADSVIVETSGGKRRIVMLSGLDYPFGYVLVDPGMPETILTGVSTDDELMDQVDWYFGVDEEEPDSAPGQVVLNTP